MRGVIKSVGPFFLLGCVSCALVFLSGCRPRDLNERTEHITLLAPSGETLTVLVEIADEPSEQRQGLMFRRNLPKGRGMLFVFSEPQILSFWMKNTLIPLDVVFFDSQGVFVSSQRMVPCNGDPCPLYNSGGLAQYALEVPAGYVAEQSIGAKWQLRFP